jgi:hypothetical protein
LSYFYEGVGWLVRAIGKAVNWLLPGNPANGLVKAGEGMMDAAKAARENASATETATDAVNDFAAALSNVPRVLNINALRNRTASGSAPTGGPTTGGGATTGGGGDDPRVGGGDGIYNRAMAFYGDIHVHGVEDVADMLEKIGRATGRTVARGGTSRLAIATASVRQ